VLIQSHVRKNPNTRLNPLKIFCVWQSEITLLCMAAPNTARQVKTVVWLGCQALRNLESIRTSKPMSWFQTTTENGIKIGEARQNTWKVDGRQVWAGCLILGINLSLRLGSHVTKDELRDEAASSLNFITLSFGRDTQFLYVWWSLCI